MDAELTRSIELIRAQHLEHGRSVEHIAAEIGLSSRTLYRLLWDEQRREMRVRTEHLLRRFADQHAQAS